MKSYYVYIMASKRQGTLYIGVTSDLLRRLSEHRQKIKKGFTQQYDVIKLVYYEETWEASAAIAREKQLKNWHRDWKINLIERENPFWDDLSLTLMPHQAEEWILKQVQDDKVTA